MRSMRRCRSETTPAIRGIRLLDRARTSSACQSLCAKNDKANHLGLALCNTQGPHLIMAERRLAAFLGGLGKFTPRRREKLYLGGARRRVKRPSTRTRTNGSRNVSIRNRLKYEIENSRILPSRSTSSRTCGTFATRSAATRPRLEWEPASSDLRGGPDKEKSTSTRCVPRQAASRAKDGKADKKEHKLNVILKNECVARSFGHSIRDHCHAKHCRFCLHSSAR